MEGGTGAAAVGAAEGSPPAPGRLRPRPFRPAWWLPGAHAQTLVGRALRRGAARYSRVRWETPDGDFLDLDVWTGSGAAGGRESHAPGPAVVTALQAGASAARVGRDPAATAAGDAARDGARPLVLVLHGLEGCSESAYVVETCRRLAGRGISAVAMNFRSRSGEPNRARRFYHSGETGDLAFVLDRLRDSGVGPLGVVGYSLGGNVLLKYLGERGDDARRRVDAAAAVSVPYRLAAAARRMEEGTRRIYAGFFLRSLRRSLREKSAARGHDYDLERLDDVRTLREFDDRYTAPIHGFRGAEDYYRRCSSARFLGDVRVPTLLLHARDDPFLPDGALPEDEMGRNPWLLPWITDRGGHMGFVMGGAPWNARFWAEAEVARFLARALESSRA